MATKEQKAREAGIEINPHRADYRTPCPACSPLRRKKRDPCLHVTIDRESIRYHCHHCQDFSGAFFDDRDTQTHRGDRGRRGASQNRVAPRCW